MVLNVFRPNSRVHASRPIDSDANFRRFVPYFADTDVTASFLVDRPTSRRDTEPQVDLKKPGELTTQRRPASNSSPPVLKFPI